MPKWPLEKYIAWLEENLPFLHHSEMSTYKKIMMYIISRYQHHLLFSFQYLKKKRPIKLPMSCFFILLYPFSAESIMLPFIQLS